MENSMFILFCFIFRKSGLILTNMFIFRPYLNKKSDEKVLRYSQDWCTNCKLILLV